MFGGDLLSRALRALPGGSLATAALERVVTTADTLLELPHAVARGMRALPRIAAALERMAGMESAIRELAQVHGSLVRLEQLGTYIAAELPEHQHQLDGLREQLHTLTDRLADVSQAMLNLTLTPRELDRVLRDITGTIAPLEGMARRLERLSRTPAGPRPANRRAAGE